MNDTRTGSLDPARRVPAGRLRRAHRWWLFLVLLAGLTVAGGILLGNLLSYHGKVPKRPGREASATILLAPAIRIVERPASDGR